MMTSLNLATATYKDLVEFAREQSRSLGRYCAVVDITTYMQERTQTTVMTSTTPIKSFARGGAFVGVGIQFRNGQPYGSSLRPVPVAQPVMANDDDTLPF